MFITYYLKNCFQTDNRIFTLTITLAIGNGLTIKNLSFLFETGQYFFNSMRSSSKEVILFVKYLNGNKNKI